MEASVRLLNEFKSFQKNRSFGMYAVPDPTNIFNWKCQFYHKGYFFSLTMKFTKDYPFNPPKIKFEEKVFHPNIYSDNSVCLDIISMKWSPSLTIKDVLNGLKQLFDNPNPNSPANPDAGALYSKTMDKYQKEVKKCNDKFHLNYKKLKFEKNK